jgi:hypothetical protein
MRVRTVGERISTSKVYENNVLKTEFGRGKMETTGSSQTTWRHITEDSKGKKLPLCFIN